jgi:hypothetical protein
MRKGTRANKQRLEKRRRTRRKQRGGAISNLTEWLDAVKKSPAFLKNEDIYKPSQAREQPVLRLGEYRMSDLKNPNLTLPPIIRNENDHPEQVQEGFNINEKNPTETPFDIRIEGANLLEKWSPVMHPPSETAGSAELAPTPAEFKDYINQNEKADVNNPNPDFPIAVDYFIMAENKLRYIADTKPIESLTDDTSYPLFVWVLMMNLPENTQPAPSLVSKEQVEKELQSQGLSEKREEIATMEPVQPAV